MTGTDLVPGDWAEPVAAVENRLGEIRTLRESDDYWNADVQAEERELLEKQLTPGHKGLSAVIGVRRELEASGQWYDVESTFDALPDNIHQAVGDMLMAGSDSVFVGPVSYDDLGRFRATPAGQIVVREWGGDAAQKLAIVRERCWRVIDKLSDADADSALYWMDHLEPTEAAAILRALAR